MKPAPLWISIGLLLTSFILSLAYVADVASAFFLPQFRVWEILLGAVLAAIHIQTKYSGGTSSRISLLLAAMGIILMCLAVVVIDKSRAFPGWWGLMPTLGAVLIIASSSATWLNRVVLGSPIMVFWGKIGFPLYLWHWPLLSMARVIEVGSQPLYRDRGHLIIAGSMWLGERLELTPAVEISTIPR